MTPDERLKPEILNMNRKMRIARGCGQTVHEINAFIKQFEEMRKMMHMMSKGQGMSNMMNQMRNFRR
jgi:signal recognition particle subunit SRP54